MTWSAAREHLVAQLATLAITDPQVETIARVYEYPPATISDTPCVIVNQPYGRIERGPNGRRLKYYTIRLRLLVHDSDLPMAVELVDAWREALIDLLDGQLTLGDSVQYTEGLELMEAASFQYNDKSYTGQDFLLPVRIKDARTFAGG
jgi:hypothetical protein